MVAIKNATGQILWSWHIWVTTYDGSTRFSTYNGLYTFTFMDRALGANNNSGGIASCGLLYQWGRKDPFPGLAQAGVQNDDVIFSLGDNNPDPTNIYNTWGVSYQIYPVKTPDTTPNNLTNAIRNPDSFYYGTFDWYSSNGNISLWGGVPGNGEIVAPKSVFDPCPAGWSLPPRTNGISPFEGMRSGFSVSGHCMYWPGTGGYFLASGRRDGTNEGRFYEVGKTGYYWQRGGYYGEDTSYFYRLFLKFSISSSNTYADPENYYEYPTCGLPVRCCLVTTY